MDISCAAVEVVGEDRRLGGGDGNTKPGKMNEAGTNALEWVRDHGSGFEKIE
jgi:hypothetical protein